MLGRMASIQRSSLFRQPLQGTFFTGRRRRKDRRKAKDMNLAASDVFLPSPGPTDGEGGKTGPVGPTARENGKLVGIVIRQTQFAWFAYRTSTWGGTDFITDTMDKARHWLEGACGHQVLRQKQIQLPGGALATEFWNDSWVP